MRGVNAPLTCRQCGESSAFAEGFVSPEAEGQRQQPLCITCEQDNAQHKDFYAAAMAAVFWLLVLGYAFAQTVTGALFTAVAIYVLLYCSVIMHELGHFIAGRLMGMQVPVFSLGGGLRSRVVLLKDMTLLIGLSPQEGYVQLLSANRAKFRRQLAVTLVAGPMVNLLLGGTALALLATDISSDLIATLLGLVVLVNLVDGVSNLWPRVARDNFGQPMATDGAQLAWLSGADEESLDEGFAAQASQRAVIPYMCGRYEQSAAAFEKLAADELSPELRFIYISTLIETGQIQTAWATLQALAETADDLTAFQQACMQSLEAYLLLLSPDSDLDKAQNLAAVAYRFFPMGLAFKATLGTIYVLRGETEQGLELLEDERFRSEVPPLQAQAMAGRALGYRKLGLEDAANQAVKEVRRLQPSCPLLPLIAA